MNLNLSLDTVLTIWVLVAIVGILCSVGSLLLMGYEVRLHPAALDIPAVRKMKRHNQAAEVVRLFIQCMAVVVGVGVLHAHWSIILAAGFLTVMNSGTVGNSLNELLLTIRLVFGSDQPGAGGKTE